ncbi:helix-turn-helix domain-containing protein [Gilliamella sp. App2-1]|uniref:helix-turn-helix domain-containing protein n=2 Tax=unclassified Gilliamella TaxID=2685620 RepID=UPI001C40139F|nr:AraC family transcriptional regulator [Gilliamella apicola]
MQWTDNNGKIIEKILSTNDLLYISAQSWNKPIWTSPVTLLNILFGKQQISISLLHWDGTQLISLGQINTPRRGPRVGTFIIQALNELIWQKQSCKQNQTAYYLIHSLLSNTLDLLNTEIKTSSKTTSLYEAIRQYIDIHFREDITRDFLANMFYISPNYLSHLFQSEGKIGLNEYLNHIRLEYAKLLLKDYDLNIKEIALASGFKDSNYFCRIFKKKTERTPTEYRRQYHSKLVIK